VLYAWHILPLATVAANRDALAAADPLDQTLPLQLLKSDPEARVVVNCKFSHPLIRMSRNTDAEQVHGNAGHVAQGWRTDTYRALSNQPHTHVFTIDYRGFGRSTGSPTETGLITDGRALVTYVLSLGIPPSRIVILGQSLGTAVATAVGLSFSDPTSDLLPQPLSGKVDTTAAVFRSIVLVAPFTSLPDLLLSYRIGGVLPVLAPLRNSPFLVRMVSRYILDTWPSGLRLHAYVSAAAAITSGNNGAGNVHILHARDDQDIAFAQSEKLFAMAVGKEVEALGLGVKEVVNEEGKVGVRVEMLEFGMHNRVVTYAPVGLAVMRAFESV
jgi:abhydrolase domain-containing protein 12